MEGLRKAGLAIGGSPASTSYVRQKAGHSPLAMFKGTSVVKKWLPLGLSHGITHINHGAHLLA